MKFEAYSIKIYSILSCVLQLSLTEYCVRNNQECSSASTKYIFYDVNRPEGFNLRRDVYVRMAVFIKKLQNHGNWVLVLPPWPHMYHWRSREIKDQNKLEWKNFFDVPSLEKFIPVIEMSEYLNKHEPVIDIVYILQNYEDMFTSGNFEERFSVEKCEKPMKYFRVGNDENKSYKGYFWDYKNITALNVFCLSYHGGMSNLIELIKNKEVKSFMFDHAEVGLHDRFGDKNYWDARRSMKFSKSLVLIANTYREMFLNSTDKEDNTKISDDWTKEIYVRKAVGGPYVCVHLRRRDFLTGRSKNIPSLKSASQQILSFMKKWKVNKVFIATDASEDEIIILRNLLERVDCYLFVPDENIKHEIKDGGVAIVDQIICSHSRAFIGTHESTFSFRIQEEREIFGFDPKTTFNRLCGDEEKPCSQPAKWLLVP